MSDWPDNEGNRRRRVGRHACLATPLGRACAFITRSDPLCLVFGIDDLAGKPVAAHRMAGNFDRLRLDAVCTDIRNDCRQNNQHK